MSRFVARSNCIAVCQATTTQSATTHTIYRYLQRITIYLFEISMNNLFNRNSEFNAFFQIFTEYKETVILNKLRKIDFSKRDKNRHVYLDYISRNICANQLLDEHRYLLVDDVFGNPHSSNPTSL